MQLEKMLFLEDWPQSLPKLWWGWGAEEQAWELVRGPQGGGVGEGWALTSEVRECSGSQEKYKQNLPNSKLLDLSQ